MSRVKVKISNTSYWHQVGRTRVRGGAFLSGRLLDARAIASRIDQCETATDIERFIKRLNGFFSIISEREEELILAVDHIQRYPLYYTTHGCCVSDSPNIAFRESDVKTIDYISSVEYIMSGSVGSGTTVATGVSQVHPGQILFLDSETLSVVREKKYFSYTTIDNTSHTFDVGEIDNLICSCIDRMIKYAEGRKIIFGLSGGVDSRIIALNLVRLGYKDNILAYTHRMPSGDEGDSIRAKLLSDVLGIDHITIDLNHDDFFQFRTSKNLSTLADSTGWLCRVPQISHKLISNKLNKRGININNSIFAFGHHPLGAVSGPPYELTKGAYMSVDEYISMVYYNLYRFTDVKVIKDHSIIQSMMRQNILLQSGSIRSHEKYIPNHKAASMYDRLYWSNRLARGCRDNSYVSWMPLLDMEYVKYVESSSMYHRFGKRMQVEYAEWLSHEMNVDDVPMGKKVTYKSNNRNRYVSRAIKSLTRRSKKIIDKGRVLARSDAKHGGKVYRKDVRYGVFSEEEFVSRNLHKFHPVAVVGLMLLEQDREYWADSSAFSTVADTP